VIIVSRLDGRWVEEMCHDEDHDAMVLGRCVELVSSVQYYQSQRPNAPSSISEDEKRVQRRKERWSEEGGSNR
jgi:hypothetical protein